MKLCLKYYWFVFFRTRCMSSHLALKVETYHILWMQTGEAPVCNPRTSYECVFESLWKYVTDNEASKCNCPRQCRRLIYQTTISQSKLATSAASYLKYASNAGGTVNDINNDICHIEVFYIYSFSKYVPDFTFLYFRSFSTHMLSVIYLGD